MFSSEVEKIKKQFHLFKKLQKEDEKRIKKLSKKRSKQYLKRIWKEEDY